MAGFSAGMIAGGGEFKAGLRGAASAMVFYGIGQVGDSASSYHGARAQHLASDAVGDLAGAEAARQMAQTFSNQSLGRALMQAVGGCATAAVSGDNCGRGALTAGIGKLTTAHLPGSLMSDPAVGAPVSAVVGGTLSVIGGGKFANGALTGAFQSLFNQYMSLRYRHPAMQATTLRRAAEVAPAIFLRDTIVVAGAVEDVADAGKLLMLATGNVPGSIALDRISFVAGTAKGLLTLNPSWLLGEAAGAYAETATREYGFSKRASLLAGFMLDKVVETSSARLFGSGGTATRQWCPPRPSC